MAKLDFPSSPTDGQVYAAPNGVDYTWGSTVNAWTAKVTEPLSLVNNGSISGTAEVGKNLVYTLGEAAGGVSPYVYSWEWRLTSDNSVIQTDGLTLTIPASAVGDTIYIALTATDAAANTATGTTSVYPIDGFLIAYSVFPNLSFGPITGPNASPSSVSIVDESLYGEVTATWEDGFTNIFATGDIRFSVNGGAYGTSSQSVSDGDTVSVIWDTTAIAAAADGDSLTGRLTNNTYENGFAITIDRAPTGLTFANLSNQGLSTQVTSDTITPTGYNVPVPVSFAGSSTALTSIGLSVAGGAFGASPQTVNPGQSLQLQGTTGGANSTAYGVDIAMGSNPSATDTWTVTTTAVAPSIAEPSITAPSNGAEDINPAVNIPAGVELTGSTYTPLNGAGAQTSSTWEVYENSYPLTSTNTITGVSTTPEGPFTSVYEPPADIQSKLAANSNGAVAVAGVIDGGGGDTIAYRGNAGSSFSYFTPQPGYNQNNLASDGVSTFIAMGAGYLTYTNNNWSSWTTTDMPELLLSDLVWEPFYGRFLTADSYYESKRLWGSSVPTSGLLYVSTFGQDVEFTRCTRCAVDGLGNVMIATDNDSLPQWIFVSTDGGVTFTTKNWTLPAAETKLKAVNAIIGGQGKFLVVGESGTFYVSSDLGDSWSAVSSPAEEYAVLSFDQGSGILTNSTGTSVSYSSNMGLSWARSVNFTELANTVTTGGVTYILGTFNSVARGIYTGNFPSTSVLTISGAASDGFKVGDVVVSQPSGGGPGNLTAVSDSSVTVTPASTGWVTGQRISIDSSSYSTVSGSPFTVSSAPFETINIAQSAFSTSSSYYARVQYASATTTSDYSPWSEFSTASSFVPDIGGSYGGGYYAGQINDGGTIYNLVIAPVTSNDLEGQYGGATPDGVQWKVSDTADTPAATAQNEVYGQPATTTFSSTIYPMFNWCVSSATGPNAGTYDATNSVGTGINGYNDWYIPAKNELAILYFFLKPDTSENNTSAGSNPNSVEPYTPNTNYGPGFPNQTTNPLFQTGGAQALNTNNQLWSSSEDSVNIFDAGRQDMGNGTQSHTNKTVYFYARAIRRVAA